MENETMTEIAYTRSGFVRVVKFAGDFYEVQAQSIRGQSKLGSLVFWKKLYGIYDRDKAIKLMESYAA